MNRENFLRFLQKEHVVFLDGAMGTYLYEQGVQMDACIEAMNLERPDVIRKVHACLKPGGILC